MPRFNGPDLDMIYAQYSLRADMPARERRLCAEVERLRDVLGNIIKHDGTDMRGSMQVAVLKEMARRAIYPNYINNDHGNRS